MFRGIRPASRAGHVPVVAVLCMALACVPAGCASRQGHDDTGRADNAGIAVPATWSGGNATTTAAPALPATTSAIASSATPAPVSTPTELTDWWQHFNDPLLSTLVADALRKNPGLWQAQAAVEQARALRTAARSAWFPSVDANANVQRSTGSAQTGSSATTTRYGASLDASWEPDLFGATRSDVRAANADLAASEATLAATQVSLSAEVALAYVAVRGYQQRRDIAQQNLAAQDETLALTGWRADAGLASSLDTLQARANREQTRAQLAALDASLATAEHNLAVLCGQPPAALHDLLAPRQPVPLAAADVLADIPANTLRQRPDVRAAELHLRAEAARVDKARAARWPSLQISGSLGVAALTPSGLSAADAATRSLLAGLTLPLFDAGRQRAAVAAQLAVREQSLANYQSTILAALQDVEDALATIATSRERVDALRNASAAAESAAQLARQQYAAGTIDFQSLLDSERTALSVADGLAAAHADEASAQIRLYKSLGGGWQPGQPGDDKAVHDQPVHDQAGHAPSTDALPNDRAQTATSAPGDTAP